MGFDLSQETSLSLRMRCQQLLHKLQAEITLHFSSFNHKKEEEKVGVFFCMYNCIIPGP